MHALPNVDASELEPLFLNRNSDLKKKHRDLVGVLHVATSWVYPLCSVAGVATFFDMLVGPGRAPSIAVSAGVDGRVFACPPEAAAWAAVA